MKTQRSAIALALGIAMAAFGANAQTTQGANPAAAPQTGPTTHAADADTRQPAARAGDANQSRAGQANQESQLNQEDHSFLENAIQGSHAEIEGSELALEKTESADVREFAQMMIKDHTEMMKEATALAQKKGMTPPDGPSMMQTTEITGLKALTGGAFDAMYVNRIGVASHEATVEMFEEASQQAEDPEVKAMATKTLPKLREHLEMARALNEKQDKQ